MATVQIRYIVHDVDAAIASPHGDGCSRVIRVEVAIEAAPADVWRALTDFAEYPAWNPFITALEGELRAGARLRGRLRWPGAGGISIRPRIVRLDPPREMRWTGHHIAPLVLQGRHVFRLAAEGDGRTRFVHSESLGGWFLPFYWKGLERNLGAGFAAMSRALKARCEGRGTA